MLRGCPQCSASAVSTRVSLNRCQKCGSGHHGACPHKHRSQGLLSRAEPAGSDHRKFGSRRNRWNQRAEANLSVIGIFKAASRPGCFTTLHYDGVTMCGTKHLSLMQRCGSCDIENAGIPQRIRLRFPETAERCHDSCGIEFKNPLKNRFNVCAAPLSRKIVDFGTVCTCRVGKTERLKKRRQTLCKHFGCIKLLRIQRLSRQFQMNSKRFVCSSTYGCDGLTQFVRRSSG